MMPVCVTVTVNGAAVPPALLAIEPVHVPALGVVDATETANVTEPPSVGGVELPTAAICATVPGELFAPGVQFSAGVKSGCALACEMTMFCVVGEPPMTKLTLDDDEITSGPGDGDGLGVGEGLAAGVGLAVGEGLGLADGLAVGVGLGEAVAVAVVLKRYRIAGTLAVNVNGEPFEAKTRLLPETAAGRAQVRFHFSSAGS
jgi:hypothetical protein